MKRTKLAGLIAWENSTLRKPLIISLIVPIEVKAEENLQAKSLKVYLEKFSPTVSIRTSMSDFRKQDWLINLPLYAISELKNFM